MSGSLPSIFQPQPRRAGNAFLGIQQALNSDRESVQSFHPPVPRAHLEAQPRAALPGGLGAVGPGLFSNVMQQPEVINRNTLKHPKVRHHAKQLQQPLLLGHMGEFRTDLRPLSIDGNAIDIGVGSEASRGALHLHDDADDDDVQDDYDYYGGRHPCQHDVDHSSCMPPANNSEATPVPASAIVHDWINYFTPRELVSVNAECSIFSPGSNWPGNVNLKKIEVECQYRRNELAAQHTLASLVLRAEAEQAFGLARAQPSSFLNQVAVETQVTQAQSKTNIPQKSQNTVLQGILQMPPPTTSSDHVSTGVSSSSAAKRPRSNTEKDRIVSSKASQATAAVQSDLSVLKVDSDAVPPVVDVHVPSFCECGAAVVGVWYNKKPHYCQWFRHARYAALRKLLEQNRCKSKCVRFAICNAKA